MGSRRTGRSRPDSRRWERTVELRWAGVGLFLLALAMRLLFWQATADSSWPYPAAYKGDALVWLDYAAALRDGEPFELGLPLRPPGNAYLVHWIWSGAKSATSVRLAWCLLGVSVVWLLYRALRSAFSPRIAVLAGLYAAVSSGLMLLSSSPNNETPYLVAFLVGMLCWQPLLSKGKLRWGLAWGAANALACLLRVEHALFFALASAWLVVDRLRSRDLSESMARSRREVLQRSAISLAAFALVLFPWHLDAWRSIDALNRQAPAQNSPTERAQLFVERQLSGVRWEPAAAARRNRLPAFARRASANFVAATVAWRGAPTVQEGDLEILQQAFGYLPQPLPGRPFVALYGGLNFALANQLAASGGFDRTPLAQSPPLTGGAERYPPFLVHGLPPDDLSLTYPGHLRLVNDGYRLGWDWIHTHPGDFGQLAGRKLAIFWQGLSLGLGGYDLPMGPSGLRRPVDMVVPDPGALSLIWRSLLALALAAGLWSARDVAATVPWLLFALHKLMITVAFFGYARQGASTIPVVALLVAIATDRRLAFSLLAVEAWRWVDRPPAEIGGRAVAVDDPWPADDHLPRDLLFR